MGSSSYFLTGTPISQTYTKQYRDLSLLVKKIDCKLSEIGKKQYISVVYGFDNINDSCMLESRASSVYELIHFKRILQNRICNPEYLCEYSDGELMSKTITLLNRVA